MSLFFAMQDSLFDLENGGADPVDDSDLNEDVAKLRCDPLI